MYMTARKILLVDDEAAQRRLLAGFLAKNGYSVSEAGSGEESLTIYRQLFAPVAVVDMKMPGMSGLELLERLKEINPYVQVIVLTAFGSVETAVDAMRCGAYDYLTKPVEDLGELLIKLDKAAEQNRLIRDNQIMAERLAEIFPASEMIGESSAIKKVKELISLVAPQNATVLITGPSGTGKELVARAIHALSTRAANRLVAINCTAFPETLLEAELFGFEKGAFTGADKAKQGRFELADGGTLFLDEIGEMSPGMQVKLLRVLDEHVIERLGGTKSIALDLRLVAATNRDLEAMVADGRFREDLFYRLNVIRIALPSLAQRPSDILLIASKFVEEGARKFGKAVKGISREAAAALTSYGWPGNVRELENVIQRAMVLTRSEYLTVDDLGGIGGRGQSSDKGAVRPMADVEKDHIKFCLDQLRWNLGDTAERLGIHRNTLRSKIKEYGLVEKP